MNQRIFFDIDGTLAVWKSALKPEELYEKGYFKNLLPHPESVEIAKHFLENEPDWDVYILSAVLSDSAHCISEKNIWVDAHLPQIPKHHRIYVSNSTPKWQAVPGGICPTDVLVDDYTKNLLEWQEYAVAIKILNGINHTNKTWTGERFSLEDTRETIISTIKQAAANARLSAKPRSRFLGFIDSQYIRDAQAYLEDCQSDDIDLNDEEHEDGWQDISGPVLVYDGFAESEDIVRSRLKEVYPNASNNVFHIEQMASQTSKNSDRPRPAELSGEWECFYDMPERQQILRIYFNPDSYLGGQLVYDYVDYDKLGEAYIAYTLFEKAVDFYSTLHDVCSYEELTDIVMPCFDDCINRLIQNPPTWYMESVSKNGVEVLNKIYTHVWNQLHPNRHASDTSEKNI